MLRFAFAERSLTALSVTLDSILVRDDEPTAVALAGDIVLLSLRAGAYFGFNRVASEIWSMLAAPCRVGEIFNQLAKTHDADGATIARDVTPFLQTLIENHLARVIDPGDPR
jgi:hypothetical protein